MPAGGEQKKKKKKKKKKKGAKSYLRAPQTNMPHTWPSPLNGAGPAKRLQAALGCSTRACYL